MAVPEQAAPAQAAASPEGRLRPAREDIIVQLQIRLRKDEQERDRRTAFKGAAARQAAHCRRQLQGYLKSLCLRMQGQQPSMLP